MKKCGSCSGFVPNAKNECPNCGARVGITFPTRTLGAVGALLGGGAFAMTLMACYGCPPSDTACMGGYGDDGGRTVNDPTIGSDAGRDARASDASIGSDSGQSDAAASDGGGSDGASDDGASPEAGDDAAADGG